MNKRAVAVPQMYAGFAYDENGCWSDLTRIEFDGADHGFLDRLLERGHIELDEEFIDACPSAIKRELKKVWPRLTHLHSRPQMSYFSHDCRELSLMLSGEKPFASFHVGPGEELEDVMWRPQPFDHYVNVGRILRYETSMGRDPAEKGRAILFALPGEEWRFKAYEMLYKHALTYGVSIYDDPLFGTLWGYTEEQNREFLQLEARMRGIDLKQ